MGCKPWSCCECCLGTGPGSAPAPLAPRTHPRGSRDEAAAGMLGYWKSLIMGPLASARGWPGQEKQGKILPGVKATNPSGATEKHNG